MTQIVVMLVLLLQPLFAPTPASDIPALDAFVQSVANGKSNQVVGVYVPGVFALPVVQQPGNELSYVSREQDVLTQFNASSRYHNTGLLAHNYLAGSDFKYLKVNQVVIIVYGSGRLEYARISSIQSYQALSPNSTTSNFVDLQTREQVTAAELFQRVFTQPGVTFQTCIYGDGDPSWGRLLILADPVDVKASSTSRLLAYN